MSENYYGFEKFLSLLDDNNILKNATAMGVMVHLQKCIEEIKSNVLTDLISLDENKKDHYLDLKINEIKRQDYLKNYGKDKIERWLKEFNVNLEDILKNNVESEHFYKMVDSYFEQNFDPGTTEYNTSSAAQNDFLLYFLNFYANELIAFLESKKSTFKESNKQKIKLKSEELAILITKNFDELKALKQNMYQEIDSTFGSDPWADHTEVEIKYEFDIELATSEIKRLIFELYNQSKVDNYFYFDCPSEVYKKHFEARKDLYIIDVPDAYEVDFLISEIEYFSKPYDNRVIIGDSAHNYNEYVDYNDRYRITLKRKLEFLAVKLRQYGYIIKTKEGASLIDESNGDYKGWGTEIILEKTKTSNFTNPKAQDIKEAEPKTEKQLTANQIVLLLQEIGFFTHPKIEKTSKVKQSELISKICGLNSKNIKIKIQNLDKTLKELGENHQKDIDKIDDILNNLE
ncbi:hypothetical protein [Xanthomarina spongicola]|uniref:Uncharacterized protein n=1 Tax=Xanthomarina spongicola TaxID=570520 RepID=A0A316DQ67_9FLAO|nr:hypothetical protein [Xanthomarina spongicola]PWK19628.1 hypothetical protein LX78_00977 [Xanthomarina spongicola]